MPLRDRESEHAACRIELHAARLEARWLYIALALFAVYHFVF